MCEFSRWTFIISCIRLGRRDILIIFTEHQQSMQWRHQEWAWGHLVGSSSPTCPPPPHPVRRENGQNQSISALKNPQPLFAASMRPDKNKNKKKKQTNKQKQSGAATESICAHLLRFLTYDIIDNHHDHDNICHQENIII